MRYYYNTCVTCPQCHSPYNSSKLEMADPLIKLDTGVYYCPKCHAEFSENVFLQDYSTVELPFINKESRVIPLYRRVYLNDIEKEYIRWICNDPTGIHLITWPWKDVRFLPIALTEYIDLYPEKKILVLGNYGNSINKTVNNPIEILAHTFFFDMDDAINTDQIKITKNDIQSKIYYKRQIISVKYKKYGSKNEGGEYTCTKSLIKCRNSLIKHLEEDYGSGSIRSVNSPLKNSNTKSIDPKKGVWDLTFTERPEWSGKKIQYNISWMNKVLANSGPVRYCKDILKTAVYTGKEEEEENISANIYLLNPDPEIREQNPKIIFDTIRKLNPNLVIITNPDAYIVDRRFAGMASRKLLEFLRDSTTPVILFSTEPESRQYYNLDQKVNAFSPCPIIIHTLDSDHVLKKYSYNSLDSSDTPSPLTSGKIPTSKMDKVHISYIPYLPEFYSSFSEYLQNRADLFAVEFKLFIRNLIASPLNIKDERNERQFFARRSFQNDGISYDWIKDTLKQRIEDGKMPDSVGIIFNELISKYYYPDKNPLRDLFIETAEKILKREPDSNVIFVVSRFDEKRFQKIIDDNKVVRTWNVRVTCWNKLSRILNGIDKNTWTYVISSTYPSMSFKMTNSPVKEFIFINDAYGIKHIQEILDRRLLEHIVRPILHPLETEKIPRHLGEILNEISQDDAENTEDILEEYYQDEDEMAYTSDRFISQTTHPVHGDELEDSDLVGTTIPEGSDVILCVDDNERGLFIPLDTNVLCLKDNLFEDIKVDPSLSSKKLKECLLEKDIVIDKTNLYSSFRVIFFRYMMEHQNNISFERIPYRWENYKAMYFNSTEWIRYILKAIEFIHKSMDLSMDEAQEFVLVILSNSGLTAHDPNTIRLWLRRSERVPMGNDVFDLYRTEHPFKMSDVSTIYEVLKKYVPNAEKYDLEKSYVAALHIQDMRSKVLKGGKSLKNKAINVIYDGLKKERAAILSNAEIFHPKFIRQVILVKSANAMKITNNYEEYL